jgi:hypothetical protein
VADEDRRRNGGSAATLRSRALMAARARVRARGRRLRLRRESRDAGRRYLKGPRAPRRAGQGTAVAARGRVELGRVLPEHGKEKDLTGGARLAVRVRGREGRRGDGLGQ